MCLWLIHCNRDIVSGRRCCSWILTNGVLFFGAVSTTGESSLYLHCIGMEAEVRDREPGQPLKVCESNIFFRICVNQPFNMWNRRLTVLDIFKAHESLVTSTWTLVRLSRQTLRSRAKFHNSLSCTTSVPQLLDPGFYTRSSCTPWRCSICTQPHEPTCTDVQTLTPINTPIQQSNPASAPQWQDMHY